jgi:hypothetical protein
MVKAHKPITTIVVTSPVTDENNGFLWKISSGRKEVNDLKPNYDGSYLFASMGEGASRQRAS